MLDESFVKSIDDRVRPEVKEINGQSYVIKGQTAHMIRSVISAKLEVFSLNNFVNAVKLHLGQGKKIAVNIDDYNRVTAVAQERLKDGSLDLLIEADFNGVFEKFPSSTRFNQEDFITRVQALFEDDFDRPELLKIVGSVKTEADTVSSDDGVTQQVQIKAGVHLSKEAKIRNPWILSPYKTFAEIQPVQVPYVLRVTRSRETEFALHESDGGRWKVKTIDAIREFLAKALEGSGAVLL